MVFLTSYVQVSIMFSDTKNLFTFHRIGKGHTHTHIHVCVCIHVCVYIYTN
jgi:hypothetical protein